MMPVEIYLDEDYVYAYAGGQQELERLGKRAMSLILCIRRPYI